MRLPEPGYSTGSEPASLGNEIKSRRGRKSLGSFSSYEELKRYVLQHYAIDEEWRSALARGEVRVVTDREGVWLCDSRNTCFRLIKKLARLSRKAYRILASVAREGKTLTEISIETGVPYDVVYRLVIYYEKIGVIERRGALFHLNPKHPQYRVILTVINRLLGTDYAKPV